MTREEAKELLPIIQAYAQGKDIQHLSNGSWSYIAEPDFCCESSRYRITPEPKYRPFESIEECWKEMQKHEPFGWLKKINCGYKHITAIRIDMFDKHCADFAAQTGTARIEFEYIYKKYTFADGAPFGIKE